jgi:hypothetical protein
MESTLMSTASRWFSKGLKTSLAALALAATMAWADPPARVGRISDTVGTVWFYEPEQGEWVAARRNRPVTDGDRFATERGARVEVQIGSATVRLGGNTEASFDDLDDDHIRLQLKQGRMALQLRRDELARDVSVLTPQGRFEPLRAGSYRVDVEERSVLGATFAGAMRFEGRDSALNIERGQRAEFWKERGDTTHYAWTEMPDDNFAEWVAREEREDRYAGDDRYHSPEMTGAEDLHRHGRWERHAEYGSVWYPHGVHAGWAPYRDGQWAYVRPWGWTWVDNAAWGFAPFHYGRWVHHYGRWGWVPGHVVGRPVYSPALVGWIGNGNVSVSIRLGHPGYVGWVPLSPYDHYRPHYHYPVTPRYIDRVNTPYRQWHQPQHDPRRDPVMAQPAPYTHQGVAGGVTVVPRDVLRQRQPVSSATMVQPSNVAQWQSVRVEAPTMAPATVNVPRAPNMVAPATVFRGDDGREGVRRGHTPMMQVPQSAQSSQMPQAPQVQPAQPVQRAPSPAVVSLPANTVVQPHPNMAAHHEAQRRHAARLTLLAIAVARVQEQQQRREQIHRMERHLPGQRNN